MIVFKHNYSSIRLNITLVKKNKAGKAIWKSIPRDLSWLWKPITFKRPQADYLRNTNYSFKRDQIISLNVLNERIKLRYYGDYSSLFTKNNHANFGTAKLVSVGKKWFLHIPVTIENPIWNRSNNQQIVGIDRGLRQIMTCYDSRGNTMFFNGKKIAYLRHKYSYLRQRLQKANTKSAKRHLKKLGNRENGWMNDVNHCLSKTLVKHYGNSTLFVFENLNDITFETKRSSKQATHDLHTWSFYDLEQKVAYKAKQIGSQVIEVSARYTSQRCPYCSQIKKSNRNHQLHLYVCDNCGYQTNDDRIAAINLYQLGQRYIGGEAHPQYIKLL